MPFLEVCADSRRSPVNKVKLLCILASEDGLKHVSEQFPGVEVGVMFMHMLPFSHLIEQIWAAAVDRELTSDGLISPGLGDTVSTCDSDRRSYIGLSEHSDRVTGSTIRPRSPEFVL